jgi:hypothetical protein
MLWYLAITLFPFGIFYRSEEVRDDQTTSNHVLTHWEQQKELLLLVVLSLVPG